MGAEALDDFVRIMHETGERDGFSTRPKEYFEKILNCMGEDARLYMAYYEGKAIAGTLADHCGRALGAATAAGQLIEAQLYKHVHA